MEAVPRLFALHSLEGALGCHPGLLFLLLAGTEHVVPPEDGHERVHVAPLERARERGRARERERELELEPVPVPVQEKALPPPPPTPTAAAARPAVLPPRLPVPTSASSHRRPALRDQAVDLDAVGLASMLDQAQAPAAAHEQEQEAAVSLHQRRQLLEAVARRSAPGRPPPTGDGPAAGSSRPRTARTGNVSSARRTCSRTGSRICIYFLSVSE